jgi:hypothetical protein
VLDWESGGDGNYKKTFTSSAYSLCGNRVLVSKGIVNKQRGCHPPGGRCAEV